MASQVWRLDPMATGLVTIDGNQLKYVKEISIDEVVTIYDSELTDADNFYEFLTAGKTGTGTITFEVKDEDVAEFNAMEPLEADGATTFYPNGNVVGKLKHSFARLAVTGRQARYVSNGAMQTVVCPFRFTGFTTTAATGS